MCSKEINQSTLYLARVLFSILFFTALLIIFVLPVVNASTSTIYSYQFATNAQGWTSSGGNYILTWRANNGSDGYMGADFANSGTTALISPVLDLTNVDNINFWLYCWDKNGPGWVDMYIICPNTTVIKINPSPGYFQNSNSWNNHYGADITSALKGPGFQFKVIATAYGLNNFVSMDNFSFWSYSAGTANFTIKLHAYNGNYSTSPLISGGVYLNNTYYQINNTGSTLVVPKNYYVINAISMGYDNVTTYNNFQSDTTLDLYLLKQYTTAVNYNVVDSITHALVNTPNVDIYDTVTGIHNYTTVNLGQFVPVLNHLIYVNASKTGYDNVNQSYTFTGATQISLVMPSHQQPLDPINDTFITFKVWYGSRGLTGAEIKLGDNQVQIVDNTGLATFEVRKNVNYSYTVTASGFYPYPGTFYISTPSFLDIFPVSMGLVNNSTSTYIDNSFIATYKAGVDAAFNGANYPIYCVQITLTPLFNNISSTSYRLAGYIQNDTAYLSGLIGVYNDIFSPFCSQIPVKVQGLITYLLVLTLCSVAIRELL